MQRDPLATLLLSFSVTLAACSSGTDEPPRREPEEPPPEGACESEAVRKYLSFQEYSANLELTGPKGATVTLVSSDPAPPREGDNVWTLKVSVDGVDPGDISLKVDPYMPAHGHHSPVTPLITAVGDGTFRVDPVYFMMDDFWETTVTVTTGDVTDAVRFGFCIE